MQDGPDPRYKQAVIALIMIKFMYLGKCKIHFWVDMWELYHRNKLEAFTWNTSPVTRYWSSCPQALQRGRGLLTPPDYQGCSWGSQGSKSTTEKPQQPEPCWEGKIPGQKHPLQSQPGQATGCYWFLGKDWSRCSMAAPAAPQYNGSHPPGTCPPLHHLPGVCKNILSKVT